MAGERVMGTIPNAAEKKGFLGGREIYTMVITDRRIIGARLTAELAMEAMEEAGKEAKAAGKGFLKRMWAQHSAGLQVHKRYETMEPEGILREDEKNFAWDYGDIKSIKLKKGSVLSSPNPSALVDIKSIKRGRLLRPSAEKKPGEMTVESISGKKRTFTFDMRYFDKARDMLKQAAGGKLR